MSHRRSISPSASASASAAAAPIKRARTVGKSSVGVTGAGAEVGAGAGAGAKATKAAAREALDRATKSKTVKMGEMGEMGERAPEKPQAPNAKQRDAIDVMQTRAYDAARNTLWARTDRRQLKAIVSALIDVMVESRDKFGGGNPLLDANAEGDTAWDLLALCIDRIPTMDRPQRSVVDGAPEPDAETEASDTDDDE